MRPCPHRRPPQLPCPYSGCHATLHGVSGLWDEATQMWRTRESVWIGGLIYYWGVGLPPHYEHPDVLRERAKRR